MFCSPVQITSKRWPFLIDCNYVKVCFVGVLININVIG